MDGRFFATTPFHPTRNCSTRHDCQAYVQPTFAKLIHCYKLNPCFGHGLGWFYFSKREGLTLLTSYSSNVRDWKDKFFFVSNSGWEFGPSKVLSTSSFKIPRIWGSPTLVPNKWVSSYTTFSYDVSFFRLLFLTSL